MEKEKKSYCFKVFEAKDGEMTEVLNFNFGGHHDLAKLVEKTKAAGLVSEDHCAKELVVGLRLLHHVVKNNLDNPLFAQFAPHLKEFKHQIKAQIHDTCGCECNE